jgi:hypothetical protein
MNQNFDAFVGGQSDGVPLPVNLDDFRAAGGQNPMIDRIDGQAVAGHPLGENRIRHILKRHHGTGQRGIEDEIHEAYNFLLSDSNL